MQNTLLKCLLENPGVHCRDVESVLTKIHKMKLDGHQRLQVFSDFDHTLSCYRVNGSPGCTTHGVIENSHLLPQEYRQKAEALKETYCPFEVAQDVSIGEKIRAMEQWWEGAHQLLVEYRFSQTMLSKMIQTANIALRNGHEEFFSTLEAMNVPFVLFSAGLGDVIAETLKQRSYYPQNIEIIGNMMVFDTNGRLVGFSEPVIHSYNKGITAMAKMKHLMHKLQDRSNVLLLGDSQGDPYMVDGLNGLDNIVKIGFLNYKVEQLLPVYMNLYDIVLTEDETLLTPNSILKYLLS